MDDEPEYSKSLKDILELELANANIELAENGLEALYQLENNQFDIVISDIRMPGISGVELIKIMNQRCLHIPVILMTGFTIASSDGPLVPHVGLLYKPFKFEELIYLVLDVTRNKGIFQASQKMFPNNLATYRNLYKCHSTIRHFLKNYQSNDLFEIAIRHKIKDSVNEFCVSVVQDILNSAKLSNQLYIKLNRLQSLMQQIKHGSETGLQKMLKGIKEDIESERPNVNVTLSTISRLPPSVGGSNIETFLAFCALEFVDNALDAIEKQGKIRIVLRKKQTSNFLLLSVWNDGPAISTDLASQIFKEGVTSKGPGRGMGLYIIKSLCDQFNAVVKLTQDDGVQFSVFVPLST